MKKKYKSTREKFKDLKIVRPFSLSQELSQGIITVSNHCHLQCNGCTLWKNNSDEDFKFENQILNNIKNKTLWKQIQRKKIINVVGGDPFKNPQIIHILKWLKQKRKKVRLWTHGQLPIEVVDEIVPFVHHIMIYVPTVVHENYHLITGRQWTDQVEEIIARCRFYKVPVTIHASVKIITIEELPDLREWTYTLGIPLLIHYNKKLPMVKGSVDYVKRFASVPGVEVMKDHAPISIYCPEVSTARIGDPFQIIKTHITSWFKSNWRYVL
jgi:molybdenum cofactor biosynthesis enzyme MoaA